MCQELSSEVAKLMSIGSNYIKKKAALAATKIVRKIPNSIPTFADKVENLLSERNHGFFFLLCLHSKCSRFAQRFVTHFSNSNAST